MKVAFTANKYSDLNLSSYYIKLCFIIIKITIAIKYEYVSEHFIIEILICPKYITYVLAGFFYSLYIQFNYSCNFFIFQNISDEKFESLFEGLENNTHLESLSLTNVGLTDRTANKLADALEKNNTLRVVNVETNFISPTGVVRLVKSLLKLKSVEEFRAANQVNYCFI